MNTTHFVVQRPFAILCGGNGGRLRWPLFPRATFLRRENIRDKKKCHRKDCNAFSGKSLWFSHWLLLRPTHTKLSSSAKCRGTASCTQPPIQFIYWLIFILFEKNKLLKCWSALVCDLCARVYGAQLRRSLIILVYYPTDAVYAFFFLSTDFELNCINWFQFLKHRAFGNVFCCCWGWMCATTSTQWHRALCERHSTVGFN